VNRTILIRRVFCIDLIPIRVAARTIHFERVIRQRTRRNKTSGARRYGVGDRVIYDVAQSASSRRAIHLNILFARPCDIGCVVYIPISSYRKVTIVRRVGVRRVIVAVAVLQDQLTRVMIERQVRPIEVTR